MTINGIPDKLVHFSEEVAASPILLASYVTTRAVNDAIEVLRQTSAKADAADAPGASGIDEQGRLTLQGADALGRCLCDAGRNWSDEETRTFFSFILRELAAMGLPIQILRGTSRLQYGQGEPLLQISFESEGGHCVFQVGQGIVHTACPAKTNELLATLGKAAVEAIQLARMPMPQALADPSGLADAMRKCAATQVGKNPGYVDCQSAAIGAMLREAMRKYPSTLPGSHPCFEIVSDKDGTSPRPRAGVQPGKAARRESIESANAGQVTTGDPTPVHLMPQAPKSGDRDRSDTMDSLPTSMLAQRRASSISVYTTSEAVAGDDPQVEEPRAGEGDSSGDDVDDAKQESIRIPGLGEPYRPGSLAKLKRYAQAHNGRHIDCQTIADIINTHRLYGPRAEPVGGAGGEALTRNQLEGAINDDVLHAWWRAMGFTKEDIDAMRAQALKTGFFNPLAALPGSAMTYAVMPFITPMTGPAFGFVISALASVASPTIAALLQPGVVDSLSYARMGTAPTVEQSKEINDKELPAALADKLRQAVENFAQARDAFERLLQQTGGAQLAAHAGPPDVAAIQAFCAGLSESQLRELQVATQRLADSLGAMYRLQQQLDRAQASEKKQDIGNRLQIVPRLFKGAAATGASYGKAPDPATTTSVAATTAATHASTTLGTAADTLLEATTASASVPAGALGPDFAGRGRLGDNGSAGLATGFFAMFALIQSFCAAKDEWNKHRYAMVTNILQAPVFTPEGDEAWKAGEEIQAEHIDPHKVMALTLTPVQATIKQVLALVTGTAQEAKSQRQALLDRAAARTPTPRQLEQASTLTDKERAELQTLDTVIERLERDATLIRNGHLDELRPDSLAASLLMRRPGKMFSPLHWNMVKAKYRTQNEIKAQIAQKEGQLFNLVVAGPFGALVGPKLVMWLVWGGSSKTPNGPLAGMAFISLMLGIVGAVSQSKAISVKNNARGQGNDYSFFRQLGRTVLMLPHSLWAQYKSSNALKDLHEQLARDFKGAQDLPQLQRELKRLVDQLDQAAAQQLYDGGDEPSREVEALHVAVGASTVQA